MAIADASVAALFSLVTTPILSAPTHSFDDVARLFCAALISLFVWSRALFATSACALLATTTSTDRRFDRLYPATLWLACVLWLAQSAAVAFGVGAQSSLVRGNSRIALTSLSCVCFNDR